MSLLLATMAAGYMMRRIRAVIHNTVLSVLIFIIIISQKRIHLILALWLKVLKHLNLLVSLKAGNKPVIKAILHWSAGTKTRMELFTWQGLLYKDRIITHWLLM